MLEPKMGALFCYILVLGIGCWFSSWAIFGNNQTAPILEAKFEWNESEAKLWSSLIGNISVLGIALGSIFSGPVINKGRRRILIVMNGVFLIGTVLTLFLTIPTIFIGRFI